MHPKIEFEISDFIYIEITDINVQWKLFGSLSHFHVKPLVLSPVQFSQMRFYSQGKRQRIKTHLLCKTSQPNHPLTKLHSISANQFHKKTNKTFIFTCPLAACPFIYSSHSLTCFCHNLITRCEVVKCVDICLSTSISYCSYAEKK